MKFSTIVAQGLLLSGIIASPIADPVANPVADAVPDTAGLSVVSSLPDQGVDILSNGNETLIQKSKKETICSDVGKDKACYLGDFNKCIPYYITILQLDCQQGDPQMRMACLAQQPVLANKFCGFWCSRLKSIDDCKKSNKATGMGYNCKNFRFCQ